MNYFFLSIKTVKIANFKPMKDVREKMKEMAKN